MTCEESQAVSKQILSALRKTGFVFFEIGLSACGVMAGSVLLIYGLGLVRYIAGYSGPSTLAFWIICAIGILWMILVKLADLLWPVFFAGKSEKRRNNSGWMSFMRGFVFSILYISLWILNEIMPDYDYILLRLFLVNVLIVIPLICVAVVYFVDRAFSAFDGTSLRGYGKRIPSKTRG